MGWLQLCTFLGSTTFVVSTKNGSPNPNGEPPSPKTKKCNFTWATLYVVVYYGVCILFPPLLLQQESVLSQRRATKKILNREAGTFIYFGILYARYHFISQLRSNRPQREHEMICTCSKTIHIHRIDKIQIWQQQLAEQTCVGIIYQCLMLLRLMIQYWSTQ